MNAHIKLTEDDDVPDSSLLPTISIFRCTNCGTRYLDYGPSTPDVSVDPDGLTRIRVQVLPTSEPFKQFLQVLELKEFLGRNVCIHSEFISFSTNQMAQATLLRLLEDRRMEQYQWGIPIIRALRRALGLKSL